MEVFWKFCSIDRPRFGLVGAERGHFIPDRRLEQMPLLEIVERSLFSRSANLRIRV